MEMITGELISFATRRLTTITERNLEVKAEILPLMSEYFLFMLR